MTPLKLGKSGWHVIGAAVEDGWGQTLRLALLLFLASLLMVAILVCAHVAVGWLSDVGMSTLSRALQVGTTEPVGV